LLRWEGLREVRAGANVSPTALRNGRKRLADLREPELGSFSLAEMTSIRLPFGMGVERDLVFTGMVPIGLGRGARRTGTIRAAKRLI
jgi:hypothetical protein